LSATITQNEADKRCWTVQHPAMHVVCPHCQAAYQLEGVDEGTILVCHRCGTEFGFGQPPEGARIIGGEQPDQNKDEEPLPLFSANPTFQESGHDDGAEEPSKEATESASSMEEVSEDEDTPLSPPPRASARIMPWLLTILLVIAAAGFWSGHDAWLDDPWLRSVLINAGLPVEVRDKDWRIQPESVQAQWVKRDDGSQVLVIEGRVKNLLHCELAPPAIHFSIFAKDDPEHLLLQRDLPVSQPPLMVAIRRAPYIAPPGDRVPVTALGDRGFVLVLEGLPKNAGDFTLTPIARP